MGNFDVVTAALVRLLGIDPLAVPLPISLIGIVLDLVFATAIVCGVWSGLRWSARVAADLLEVQNHRQRIVVARGLTRHDFDQIRRAIRGWYVLLVRYGTDDYLKTMAGPADRNVGRPRYTTLGMKLSLSPTGEAVLQFSLPIHRRLGTQFRCYIALRKGETGASLLTDMLAHYDEIEVLAADVPEPTRLYFLLTRFRVASSGEGIRQNFVLPE